MVRIRGFSANLNPSERMDIQELAELLNGIKGKAIFIYRRQEVQLHGIRFSASAGEVQFLLKEVKDE